MQFKNLGVALRPGFSLQVLITLRCITLREGFLASIPNEIQCCTLNLLLPKQNEIRNRYGY